MKHGAEMAHLGNNCIELLEMQKTKLQVKKRVIAAVNLLSTGKVRTGASLLDAMKLIFQVSYDMYVNKEIY